MTPSRAYSYFRSYFKNCYIDIVSDIKQQLTRIWQNDTSESSEPRTSLLRLCCPSTSPMAVQKQTMENNIKGKVNCSNMPGHGFPNHSTLVHILERHLRANNSTNALSWALGLKAN